MVHVCVEKDIPLAAQKVWALLADFGDISWTATGEADGVSRSEAEDILQDFYAGLLDVFASVALGRE